MDPVFELKTLYDILLFESDLGTLDTSNLELVLFSCSATQPCTIFEKMYGGCCRKTTKFQRHWKVAIRCVFGKYTVQRQIHTSVSIKCRLQLQIRFKRLSQ